MKRAFFLFLVSLQLICLALKGESVVMIHGFMGTTESMRAIQQLVTHCGFCAYPWSYPSQQKYFEEHACDLVATLHHIACKCPGEPIHFVAYSSGALILRLALNKPDCPQEAKIGRATLIAPSNQGSCLARHFRGWWPVEWALGDRSGWELMNLQPNQIGCFGDFPPSMKVLVLAGRKGNRIFFKSPNDGWLAVEETYLNTPFFFKLFPFSHGELLTKRDSLICIKAFLTNP